jgi:hypothetical protein
VIAASLMFGIRYIIDPRYGKRGDDATNADERGDHGLVVDPQSDEVARIILAINVGIRVARQVELGVRGAIEEKAVGSIGNKSPADYPAILIPKAVVKMAPGTMISGPKSPLANRR